MAYSQTLVAHTRKKCERKWVLTSAEDSGLGELAVFPSNFFGDSSNIKYRERDIARFTKSKSKSKSRGIAQFIALLYFWFLVC